MPTRFLSRSEIERLESFPAEIDRDELAEHFHLVGEDLGFVRSQYGPEGQLGIAVQLCALRWLGFVPDDLTMAPLAAVESLAATLDVPARALFDYSVRPQTRREHRPLVRAHAGWRTFGDAEQDSVGGLAGRGGARARASDVALGGTLPGAAETTDRASGDRPVGANRGVGARACARPHLRAVGQPAHGGGARRP